MAGCDVWCSHKCVSIGRLWKFRVFKRCDATDAHLERMLVKLSVYIIKWTELANNYMVGIV